MVVFPSKIQCAVNKCWYLTGINAPAFIRSRDFKNQEPGKLGLWRSHRVDSVSAAMGQEELLCFLWENKNDMIFLCS